ncbi:hypothetical protein AG1IA_01110 [Rhizoctonia solani AG-1 IA]|uniref:Uncharacterized protein n=1 Tax=Thanatephorus cucumeris (strain AG1-IA) TaxID=983506 RepID=L8X3J7_THACA|nr:hypothetical protein AG1IA_01110 [Rhizoctonia solani AG-1 IA]
MVGFCQHPAHKVQVLVKLERIYKHRGSEKLGFDWVLIFMTIYPIQRSIYIRTMDSAASATYFAPQWTKSCSGRRCSWCPSPHPSGNIIYLYPFFVVERPRGALLALTQRLSNLLYNSTLGSSLIYTLALEAMGVRLYSYGRCCG